MQFQLVNNYHCVGGVCFFHLGLLDPEDGGTALRQNINNY
jgi:hypothetical protein